MSIKSLRLERHLSQEQLAEIAGLNVRTIQRLENGAKPSTETLKCLAAALEVAVVDINQETTKVSYNSGQSEANKAFIYLALASIFILFAAKSETASPYIGAFFYLTAAVCFVLAAIKMIKKRRSHLNGQEI